MLDQIKLDLSASAEDELCRFLRKKIQSLKSTLADLHNNKLPAWRRAYEAVPAEAVREFPWHGASNLVIPIIAIHADTLLARVMSAVIKTDPLWVAKLIGKFPKVALDFKEAFEEYMQYVGLEPTELDLYRVYHEWFGEAIKLGTSVLKNPWVQTKESKPIPSGDGLGKVDYYTDIVYEGPRPEKLPFNDFLMSPQYKTIESADFKCHRIRYSRFALEERAWQGIYDKKKVLGDPSGKGSVLARGGIIGNPDLTSPDSVAQEQQTDAGVHIGVGDDYEEYHVYECHFKYRINRSNFVRIIAWYNEKNNKLLRAYYNYYPDEIFIAARLFYRDDYFYGYGFAETLGMFQEELSQQHNERRDNMRVANTVVWRVANDSLYNKGFRIFPGATIPGGKDEIEPLQAGQVSPMTIDEENLTLSLAEKRSGVSSPMQGMGSGTMSKRGVYSSMGTLSLMQEGNTRTDLNITDIRYAHTKLGRILAHQYAEFGIRQRAKLFGLDAGNLQAALDGIKSKSLNLPVYAATASVNREVEKQSDLMLTGVMMKHHQMVGQLVANAANQFTPPEVKKLVYDQIDAANTLMKMVFKHFGYDEVDRFVPEVAPPPAPKPQAPQQPGQGTQSQQPAQGAQPSQGGLPLQLQQMLASGSGRGPQ